MDSTKDHRFFEVGGVMMYDPSLTWNMVQQEIPAFRMVQRLSGMFGFNSSFMDDLATRSRACGFEAFMDLALTFPPQEVLASPSRSSVLHLKENNCAVREGK